MRKYFGLSTVYIFLRYFAFLIGHGGYSLQIQCYFCKHNCITDTILQAVCPFPFICLLNIGTNLIGINFK